jgi:hypothetical protein
MKRLLTVGCLAAIVLAGCVVLPVEGPGHDHHYREYRGYGYYGGHSGAPYYHRRENAGYRR